MSPTFFTVNVPHQPLPRSFGLSKLTDTLGLGAGGSGYGPGSTAFGSRNAFLVAVSNGLLTPSVVPQFTSQMMVPAAPSPNEISTWKQCITRPARQDVG